MHSLPVLPIGEQSFSALRQDKAVYVDKTGLLEEMIRCGRWYFLARPRRFGKSLTISTLKAMFEGRKDLFCGLACAKWVEEQSHHPNPVLHLDLSLWGASAPAEKLGGWLSRQLVSLAQGCGVTISAQESASETFLCAIQEIAKKKGPVVVLIDEYDTPVLHCLENRQKLVAIRETLRDFYAVLKGASESLRFVLICGITQFSRMGVFSALNNLRDISMDCSFGTITGYTREELTKYFSEYLQEGVQKHSFPDQETLLKKYNSTMMDIVLIV